MRRQHKEMLLIVFIISIIVLVTLGQVNYGGFMDSENFRFSFTMINLNLVLLILVVFLVLRNISKLILERRRGVLGSKLRTKLVLSFVTLSIIPTMVLFFTSIVFLDRSMEGWFSKTVETTFDETLNVAQIYYDEARSDAIHYANSISHEITERRLLKEDNLEILKLLLEEKMQLFRISAVAVFSSQGEELIKYISPEIGLASLPNPETSTVKAAMRGESLDSIVRTGKADIIQGVVPIRSSFNPKDIVGVLVVDYYIPESLSGRLGNIKASVREYSQSIRDKTLNRIAIFMLLSLTTLIVLFAAVWFGLKISKSLTTPIEDLVVGTQRIAKGDMGFTIEINSRDELGVLGDAFNKMVHDLRDSRLNLESAYNELAYRNRYIETVLDNVSTGVVSIGSNDTITMINPPAQAMLGIKVDKVLGRPYMDVLKDEHMPMVNDLIQAMKENKSSSVQKQITLSLEGKQMILMVHSSLLHDHNNEYMGMVVVFDDLTQLQKMQRVSAWREVARRIAHEVKNPLTPIQLSAQRLRRRYLDNLPEDDHVFDECTRVIISQVDEMKRLVDEFSNFAKMPTSVPVPNDLNKVVNDAVALYRQAHSDIHYIVETDESLPILEIDKAQMSRAIGNLLENATTALHDVEDQQEHMIIIRTIFDASLNMATLEVIDNGPGITPEAKLRLFEPYFSTKKGKGGTGLGLVIVNRVINDHNGFIRVRDNLPHGTVFSIELPVKE